MTLKARPLVVGALCVLAVSIAATGASITIAHAAVTVIPAVTSVSPTSGSTEGGLPNVTITGSGFFNGGSVSAVSSIEFGTQAVVLSTSVCSGSPSAVGCFVVVSDTQITATTPPHQQQLVDVRVVTGGGISPIASLDKFQYNAATPEAANLSVHTATGGATITVAPLGDPELSAYDFATSVNFVSSGSSISVTTSPCPTAAVSAGPGGCFTEAGDTITLRLPSVQAAQIGVPYDVTVTTLGGTSPRTPSTDNFTFGRVFDTLDVYGGLHSVVGTQPAPAGPNFSFNIARGFAPVPGTTNQGYVLDGWGGIHPVGGAASGRGGAYWKGWDIARAIVVRADGSSGYTLDGWGGLHPFGGAPTVSGTAYWSGWDIARGLVLRADGVSGYVLDGWGGLHPFGGAPTVSGTAYWSGWDIARGIVLRADGVSGYVLDGWGGLHPFGGAPNVSDTAYWSGWDIARGLVLLPDLASSLTSPSGYVLDGWGGVHQFGLAPAVMAPYYRPGFDVVRAAGAL